MKKKVISVFMLYVMAVSLFVSASATYVDTAIPEPNEYGSPVEEITYYDEELKTTITERTYFVPDENGITLYSKSGSGWYKNEKVISWTGTNGRDTTIYAQGHFEWGDEDVSVSSPSGGYDYIPSKVEVNNSKCTYGTGKYGGVFNKFAYVTYDLDLTNAVGLPVSRSVTIRVSESGNLI